VVGVDLRQRRSFCRGVHRHLPERGCAVHAAERGRCEQHDHADCRCRPQRVLRRGTLGDDPVRDRRRDYREHQLRCRVHTHHDAVEERPNQVRDPEREQSQHDERDNWTPPGAACDSLGTDSVPVGCRPSRLAAVRHQSSRLAAVRHQYPRLVAVRCWLIRLAAVRWWLIRLAAVRCRSTGAVSL
jgi:hypothetical protein